MLSPEEMSEIRALVHAELAEVEYQCARHAGSYNYLCCIAGVPVFTHRPVGTVLRTIVRV